MGRYIRGPGGCRESANGTCGHVLIIRKRVFKVILHQKVGLYNTIEQYLKSERLRHRQSSSLALPSENNHFNPALH